MRCTADVALLSALDGYNMIRESFVELIRPVSFI